MQNDPHPFEGVDRRRCSLLSKRMIRSIIFFALLYRLSVALCACGSCHFFALTRRCDVWKRRWLEHCQRQHRRQRSRQTYCGRAARGVPTAGSAELFQAYQGRAGRFVERYEIFTRSTIISTLPLTADAKESWFTPPQQIAKRARFNIGTRPDCGRKTRIWHTTTRSGIRSGLGFLLESSYLAVRYQHHFSFSPLPPCFTRTFVSCLRYYL